MPWALGHLDANGRVISFKAQSIFQLHKKKCITGTVSGTFSQYNYSCYGFSSNMKKIYMMEYNRVQGSVQ
jgi:hypothetical protein